MLPLHFSLEQIYCTGDGHGAEVGAAASSDGQRAGLHFPIADDEHKRDLRLFRFSDLEPDLLIAEIGFDAEAFLVQLGGYFLRKVILIVGNGQDFGLDGCQPNGKGSGMLFSEDPDESFDGPE